MQLLRYNYRVQVSRMIFTSFALTRVTPDAGRGISARRCCAQLFLLLRNSRRFALIVHFIVEDANFSLLPPRHRCYALLSPSLS
jgi:hypothetical protein